MSPSTKDVVVKFISLSFRTAIRCLELSATLSLLSEPLYIDDGVDARGFNGLVWSGNGRRELNVAWLATADDDMTGLSPLRAVRRRHSKNIRKYVWQNASRNLNKNLNKKYF